MLDVKLRQFYNLVFTTHFIPSQKEMVAAVMLASGYQERLGTLSGGDNWEEDKAPLEN